MVIELAHKILARPRDLIIRESISNCAQVNEAILPLLQPVR